MIQDICVNGEIRGILKVQYCQYAGGVIGKLKTHNYLVVTYLVDRVPGHQLPPGSSNTSHRWLKVDQLRPKPNYILEESTNKLLQQIQTGRGFSVAPCELLEREDVTKKKEVAHMRQESEPMGGKQPVKTKSLEQQVLELAGYGENGECMELVYKGFGDSVQNESIVV